MSNYEQQNACEYKIEHQNRHQMQWAKTNKSPTKNKKQNKPTIAPNRFTRAKTIMAQRKARYCDVGDFDKPQMAQQLGPAWSRTAARMLTVSRLNKECLLVSVFFLWWWWRRINISEATVGVPWMMEIGEGDESTWWKGVFSCERSRRVVVDWCGDEEERFWLWSCLERWWCGEDGNSVFSDEGRKMSAWSSQVWSMVVFIVVDDSNGW